MRRCYPNWKTTSEERLGQTAQTVCSDQVVFGQTTWPPPNGQTKRHAPTESASEQGIKGAYSKARESQGLMSLAAWLGLGRGLHPSFPTFAARLQSARENGQVLPEASQVVGAIILTSVLVRLGLEMVEAGGVREQGLRRPHLHGDWLQIRERERESERERERKARGRERERERENSNLLNPLSTSTLKI